MSQEKVDKMRAALDAFNRRDKTAFLAACHPDIKNVPPREWPEFVVTEGPEAVLGLLRRKQRPLGTEPVRVCRGD